MELKSRKPTRLKEYDYSTEGAYFVTICAKNRQNIFSVVGDDAHIVPTQIGSIVERYIKSIPGIDKYVIMPNHHTYDYYNRQRDDVGIVPYTGYSSESKIS